MQDSAGTRRIFGLTDAELHPVVEGLAGAPVKSFNISTTHRVRGHYGYSAKKAIPTFTYETVSGSTGCGTVFVKWFHTPGQQEAHHYAWLAETHAPVPHMYGSRSGTDGREMIFLEYLEPIGDAEACERFLDDLYHFRCFLKAAAGLNAIRPAEAYSTQLPSANIDHDRRELAQAADELNSIWNDACNEKLGDALHLLCSDHRRALPSLQRHATDLIGSINRIATGLEHGDLGPDNTAWRPETNELLERISEPCTL